MASFNNGQIVFANKTTGIITPQATELTLYNNNGKLNSINGSGQSFEVMTNVSTASLTGGLNTSVVQISGYVQANTNDIKTIYSTYANSATVAAISAGLNTQINGFVFTQGSNVIINQNSSRSWTISATSTNGTSSSGWLPVQGVGINITAPTSATYQFSVNDYIGGTAVAAVSAGLQTQVTNTNNSVNTLFSTYANSTTVASISAGLNTRSTANRNDINTIFSTYANSTTVAAISAGLNTSVVQISGYVQANITQDAVQNNSINTLFSTYANSTTVAAISAGLNTQVAQISGYVQNNITQDGYQGNSINTLFSTYANSTTVASISAGLNTRLASIDYVGSLSSGVISGGGLAINANPMLFNVSGGNGILVDDWTNPNNPTIYDITWPTTVGISATNLINNTTWIGIDKTGTINQLTLVPTNDVRRNYIILGKLAHYTHTSISTISERCSTFASPISQLRDYLNTFTLLNLGVVTSSNGANLTFKSSAGTIFGHGINFFENNKDPHSKTISAQTPVSFQYRLQNGTSYTNTTSIDPGFYDLNGVRTSIPTAGDTGANRSTNQRIYLFATGNIRIQYGQQYYSSVSAAVAGIQTEAFNVYQAILEDAVLIGILSVRRATTDLSNTSYAQFTPVSRFGDTIGGAAGVTTATLQSTYNNSVDPEIITSATLDGVTIQIGLDQANSADALQINSREGLTVSHFDGLGNITSGAISGNSGHIVSHDANGKLIDAGYAVSDLTLLTTTAAISSGLNTQVVQISGYVQSNVTQDTYQNNSINTLFSTYSNSTTVAAISAGLNSRIVAASGAYLPIGGGTLTGSLTMVTSAAGGATISAPKGTGVNNEGFGVGALAKNSSGSRNTAVGNGALASNTIYSDNTAFGYNALNANNINGQNVAIGSGACAINTQDRNTVIGYNALSTIDSSNATQNVAIGAEAMRDSYGGHCVVIGNKAGINVGNNCVVIGDSAMFAANNNNNMTVSIGWASMLNNTNGAYNTIVGGEGLRLNTGGSYNTTLGEGALYNNLTGSNNVAIGCQAAYKETGSNKLYIDSVASSINSTGTSASALVYGEFDTGRVYIKGNQIITNRSNTWSIASASGNGILVTDTFGWRDIIGQIIPDTGATAPTKSVFRGGVIGIYSFANGNQVDIPFHVPHDYAKGTDMFFHVHWSHNGTSISNNAVFTIAATVAKGFNQAIFSPEKTQTITYNTVNIATTPRYIHRIDEIQLSDNGGTGNFLDTNAIEVDSIIIINITMTTNPTIGGGSPNNVFISTADIHYQSTSMATKNKAPSFY